MRNKKKMRRVKSPLRQQQAPADAAQRPMVSTRQYNTARMSEMTR